MLDPLDKELEKRGHKFCRYADDCNIYTRSEKAGERVMLSVTNFLRKKLKLSVNSEKSAVSPSRKTNVFRVLAAELRDASNCKGKHRESKGTHTRDHSKK